MNPTEYKKITAFRFQDATLAQLYQLSFGTQCSERGDENPDFYHHYVKSLGNYDTAVNKRPIDPPSCFRHHETVEDGLNLATEEEFANLK